MSGFEQAATSQRNGLHTFLGILGLAAWLLFILGCTGWPSWSPDGAKILAPYFDPVAKQDGIALYDLKTHTARSIFVRPSHDDGQDRHPAYAQWESDGKRAIVIWPEMHSLEVSLLPLGSRKPARHFSLSDREDQDDLPLLPYPQLGKVLYVGGAQLSALDLESGAQQDVALEAKQEVYLSTDGIRILYTRKLEGGDKEFGTLDPTDLSLHPLFKVTSADLEARSFPSAELYPLVAPEPHGARLATRVKGKTEDAIAIFTPSGLQTVLKPDFGIQNVRIGLPQWAPGGKLLYLPVAAEVEPKKGQYWLAEVPIEGGRVRMTKIARFNAESDWDDEFPLTLQVSLSPDGSTLATTTAGLGGDYVPADAKRALYLVNLRDPRRTVTSIPAPLAPAPPRQRRRRNERAH